MFIIASTNFFIIGYIRDDITAFFYDTEHTTKQEHILDNLQFLFFLLLRTSNY